MYFNVKSYPLKKLGVPIAFVMVKMHLLTFKLKAIITMNDGREFELMGQWASEEEFDMEIQRFVNEKMYT